MTTSNPPPPTSQNFSMQPRGNGPAVASLICGLLGFCVPGVGGLLGIILGFIGLKRSKETATGGGMAMAGIIIGIITLLAWGGGGFAMYAGGKAAVKALEKMSEPPRAAARQYVIDLNKGDIDAALSDSSGIAKEDVASQSAILQPMGAFQDMTSNSFNINNNVCTLVGTATFAKGTKTYTIIITGTGTNWKVTEASFQ
jgi:hypothetical protein